VQFDHVAQQVPDIAEAVAWQLESVPGSRVLHQDPTWALVESAGVRLAFVLPGQHPAHVAFRVDEGEFERLAARHGAAIAVHRDSTRSFYLRGPGSLQTEIISYPDGT
jgi:hypothetical protein